MGVTVDSWFNLNIFKSGAKLNIFVLSGIGLIYSFWIQGLFVQVHRIDVSRRRDDFTSAVLDTYILTYFTTTVGLVWGVHISELRYVKLWGFIKSLEICSNIWCLIYSATSYYTHLIQYIPIIIVALAVGIFVALSVWNLYLTLSQTSVTNIEEKSNILNLPTFEHISSNIPSVHNISVVN